MNLSEIKGIGIKTELILNKIGIKNIEDFVTYYPYKYRLIKRSNLDNLKKGDEIIMDGTISSTPTLSFFAKNRSRIGFQLENEFSRFQVTIFNRYYLKKQINIGDSVTVIGTYDPSGNKIVVNEIRFSKIEKITIERMYHLVDGLTRSSLNSYIDKALTLPFTVENILPKSIEEKYKFQNKRDSIIEIHHPTDKEKLKSARTRLIYEELFSYMVKLKYLKDQNSKEIGIKKEVDKEEFNRFKEFLSFELTEDQKTSIKDIINDMNSKKRMNRLLQGDVGSGKTVVSFASIYYNYLSGYQSALMAPTEILARQHYEEIKSFFKDIDIKIQLLTGKLKRKERLELLEKLSSGKIDIVIGTHALVSDDVKYNNLGLCIIDEQHRFGVNTRLKLIEKAVSPDVLTMSATPIPRTYALTIYGDMDISNIKTMPKGRIPVKTSIKKDKDIKEVLERMYEELKKGYQIYVIAPLIEGEEDSKYDVTTLNNNMEKAFGKKYKIGNLHGKLKEEEKNKVINDFYKNEIQILVSTTVVEVGVNTKNATMIVIFDAKRFGLATLHQLRGRVGRNSLQSYCILMSNEEKERLEVLTKTTDGFEICEEDFKLRGSGDLFGERQSGEQIFKIADLKRDFNILVKAKEDSLEVIKNKEIDPNDYLDFTVVS